MPRTETRWRGRSYVAYCVNDYGEESEHKRGITRGHAHWRLLRSWR